MLMTIVDFQNAGTFLKLVIKSPSPATHLPNPTEH